MHLSKKKSKDLSQENKAYEYNETKDNTQNDDFDDIGIQFKENDNNENIEFSNHVISTGSKRKESKESIKYSTVPDLLIELESLHFDPRTSSYCWIQNSRWLIYEEEYDLELKRFSSPHLSTLSIKGLKSFKVILKKGSISLTDNIGNYLEVLQAFSKSAASSGMFTAEELSHLRNALTLNHYHTNFNMSLGTEVPIQYNANKDCFEMNDRANYLQARKRKRSSIALPESLHKVQSQKKFSECLNVGTEGLIVQVGILEKISETYSYFIRLEQPLFEDGLMDTYCPIRFIYFIFGPKSQHDELIEIGRVFSIMMSNRVFRNAVYQANSKSDIIDASKNFLDSSALIHLNKRITPDTLVHCLPQLRIYSNRLMSENRKKNIERIHKERGKDSSKINNAFQLEPAAYMSEAVTGPDLPTGKKEKKIIRVLKQFFPPFSQVCRDLKGMKKRYLSDYKDAFIKENVATVFPGIIFIYFVALSPAITFGALFNSLVSPKMTITMLLIASGSFQFIYVLLAGQPLEIIGVTPTVFVVEQVLASLSGSLVIKLETLRFWIGIYLSCLGFLFTMFNGSFIIQHFRRSVEEVYNTYYSIIFILSALFTMFKALPYKFTPLNVTSGNVTVYYNERVKFGNGGATLFLALVMLDACLYLVKINRGIYLRRSIRKILGAFNVPLGIIIVVALSMIFFPAYQLPTLNIPPSNVINLSLWTDIPDFSSVIAASSSAHVYCFCISISMFFMLMVEVSTNSISVAKAERKLQKPTLYSLNYILMLIIFPLISVFLGWPFFSGAMVRSNAHCMAMAKWSSNNAPGVPKKVIGECEQRVSGLIVGILVFLSVFLGSALRYIPMASMYGMFLYMGVMGVTDMILWKRLINLLQRRKHWNEHDYLKGFPSWNIRVLVIIQLLFVTILVILYILSQFTLYVWTMFLFPIFVGIYAILRGYAFPQGRRLNTHLSKMDKKHVVKLYTGKNSTVVIKQDSNNETVIEKPILYVDQMSLSSDTESEIY